MNQPEKMTLEGTLKNSSRAEKKDDPKSLAESFALPGRYALLAAITVAPWLFASVYNWCQNWIAIALLVAIGFWWFETALNNRRTQVIPYLTLLVLAGIVIGFIQLIPLPDWLGNIVLGRQQEIYQEFSDANSGKSISLFTEGTWKYLRLLGIGLAGLLLGCRYFRRTQDLKLLLVGCTINGVALAFVGLVQKLTDSGHILFLYKSWTGTPFGPFINRNNGAGFLLMTIACCVGLLPIVMADRKSRGPKPIVGTEMPFWRQYYFHLLYFVAELTAAKVAVLVAFGVIGAGIVSSLSRGAVVALIVGGIVTIVCYGMARKPKQGGFVIVPLVGLVFLLSGWVGFSDQLVSRFERIDLVNVESDGRIQHWKDTFPATLEMGWLGSGLGSYRGVHRLYPSGRETALFEYAENQFFQSTVEAGWPGLILFLLAWVLAAHYALLLIYRGRSATSIGMGTFGVFLLSSQATASMFDYGLYVPSNLLLMSVLVGFLAYHAHALAGRLKKTTWLRHETPNYAVQILLLVLFAAMTLAAIDWHRRANLDKLMTLDSAEFNHQTLTLDQTDQKIKEVGTALQKCKSVEAMNYLGELWIHRARLQYFNWEQEQPHFKNSILLFNEEELEGHLEQIWQITSLERIQEQAFLLRSDLSKFQAQAFLNLPFVRDNLPPAANYYRYSAQVAPLQPVAHLRYGQILAIIGTNDAAVQAVERSIFLAPQNADYRILAAVFYLQNGQAKEAKPHLRRYFELNPDKFKELLPILQGSTARRVATISNEELANDVIPDDPKLLYEFAQGLGDDLTIQKIALDRADTLLADVVQSRVEQVQLRANIRLLKGDIAGARSDLESALRSNPMDLKTRYLLANLLFEQGDLEFAEETASKLSRSTRKNRKYTRLIQEIDEAIKAANDKSE